MVKRDNEKINELQVRVLFLSGIVEAQRLELSKLKNNREIVYSPYIPDDVLRRIKAVCNRVGTCKTVDRLLEWIDNQ